ncbi:MAG: vitamin K epoxide reductase family protein [Chloroflexi bacterium]|nr:vitamin K epoxide reductase family protein [Chloroflexota bacterium]
MNKLRLFAMLVTLVGLVDSAYLSWNKLTHRQVFCGTSSQCETVNNSIYAEINGIPIAILGVGAYLVILALLYLEGRGGLWQEVAPLAVFGMSLVGTLYSAYLTYIESAVLHAVCPYCVVSAVCITLLLVLAIIRLVQNQPGPTPQKSRGG